MICARVCAKMHSLTLVHHRYVHAHNNGISSFYSLSLDPKVHAGEGGTNLQYSKYGLSELVF